MANLEGQKSDSNSLELEKVKQRKKVLKILKQKFQKIGENKLKIVEKLIESAAFMAVELTEMEKIISANGVTEEYTNGQYQKGIKKSATVEVYNTMMKNYTSVIKQLCDLLPEDDFGTSKSGDSVLNFALSPNKVSKSSSDK